MGWHLDYSPGASFFHRLNPLAKLFLSLMLCVSCFVTEGLFFCSVILLNLAMAASAGISGRAFAMLKALIKLSAFLFLIRYFLSGRETRSFPFPLISMLTDRGVLFSLMMVLRLIGLNDACPDAFNH